MTAGSWDDAWTDPWDTPPDPVTRRPEPVLGWAYLRCAGRRPDGSPERYFAGAGALHGWVECHSLLTVNAGRWWMQVSPTPEVRNLDFDEIDEEADADQLRRGMRHYVRYLGPVRIAVHRLPDNCRPAAERQQRASLAAMSRPQLARRGGALLRNAVNRRPGQAGA